MKKNELIAAVAAQTGLTKKEATPVVAAVLDAISESLKSGEKVQLTGFGTFEVRERAARTGKNPRTGKKIKIAAGKIPAFKASKTLKASINA